MNKDNNENNYWEEYFRRGSVDTIRVPAKKVEQIPYFRAMKNFKKLPNHTDIILERNSSGFTNNEFDALKNIIEGTGTSNIKMANFFQNYLGLPHNYPVYKFKKTEFYEPGKKERQRTRKLEKLFEDNNVLSVKSANSKPEKTKKNIIDDDEIIELELKLNKDKLGNIVTKVEKAKKARVKYSKSGIRPSMSKKLSNNIKRKYARTYKSMKYLNSANKNK